MDREIERLKAQIQRLAKRMDTHAEKHERMRVEAIEARHLEGWQHRAHRHWVVAQTSRGWARDLRTCDKTPIDMGEDLPHALAQLAGQFDESNPWTQQLIDVIDKYVTHEQTGGEGEDA